VFLFCGAVRRHVVRVFDFFDNRKWRIIGSGYFQKPHRIHNFHRKNPAKKENWIRKVIDRPLNFSKKRKEIEIQGFITQKIFI
jgi:hypothetical protein